MSKNIQAQQEAELGAGMLRNGYCKQNGCNAWMHHQLYMPISGYAAIPHMLEGIHHLSFLYDDS